MFILIEQSKLKLCRSMSIVLYCHVQAIKCIITCGVEPRSFDNVECVIHSTRRFSIAIVDQCLFYCLVNSWSSLLFTLSVSTSIKKTIMHSRNHLDDDAYTLGLWVGPEQCQGSVIFIGNYK